MKREDLEKLGLTKEQIDSVCDLNNKDVQPLKDELQKTQDDLKTEQDKVKTTEEALKKFEGVDLETQKQQIANLQAELKKKDDDHAAELAARDFNALIEKSITAAKGKNAKAITALLDLDTLKVSKNQQADVEAALKVLAEAEDSKMLFGEMKPDPIGKQDIIGKVDKPGAPQTETLKGAIEEYYKS